MLHQEKDLSDNSGRPLSYIILPIKSKMAAAVKQKQNTNNPQVIYSALCPLTFNFT